MTKRHITALVAATVSMGVAIYEHDRAKYWKDVAERGIPVIYQVGAERWTRATDQAIASPIMCTAEGKSWPPRGEEGALCFMDDRPK